MTAQDKTELRVLYNGQCPVCRAEIAHYATHAETRALPIRFEDLNGGDLSDWGIGAETAARRLHVMRGGERLSGMEAFLALWAAMPRYRWLARVAGAPVIRPLTGALYDRVLAPALYRWHRRRQRRAARA